MRGPADSAFHGDQRSNRPGCYFSFLFRGVTAHSVPVLVPVPTQRLRLGWPTFQRWVRILCSRQSYADL